MHPTVYNKSIDYVQKRALNCLKHRQFDKIPYSCAQLLYLYYGNLTGAYISKTFGNSCKITKKRAVCHVTAVQIQIHKSILTIRRSLQYSLVNQVL